MPGDIPFSVESQAFFTQRDHHLASKWTGSIIDQFHLASCHRSADRCWFIMLLKLIACFDHIGSRRAGNDHIHRKETGENNTLHVIGLIERVFKIRVQRAV